MKFGKLLAASALAIALAGCGGGGGSSPPPTASPTPGPSPTPTPTPTPPPVSTPPTFNELTRIQDFRAGCVRVETLDAFPSAVVSHFPSDVMFFPLTLDTASEAWTLRFRGAASSPETGPQQRMFAATDEVMDPPAGTIAYRKANMTGGTDSFAVTLQSFGGVTFDYLRGSSFLGNVGGARELDQRCIFGVPILVEDVLTGNADFPEVVVTGTGYLVDNDNGNVLSRFDLGGSTASLSFAGRADEPIEGRIETTIEFRGREIETDGSLSDTVTAFESFQDVAAGLSFGADDDNRDLGSFEGDFFDDGPNRFQGRLIGWFYGPQSVEAGYAFVFEYFQEKPEGSPPSGGATHLDKVLVGHVLAKR